MILFTRYILYKLKLIYTLKLSTNRLFTYRFRDLISKIRTYIFFLNFC